MELFSLGRFKIDQMIQDVTDYTRKVYNQSKVLYTAASPWGQIVLVLQRLASMVMYYIEDSITELNINTASRPISIYGLAALAGHQPTRSIAATGVIYIVYNGNAPDIVGDQIIIKNFTQVNCVENGLPYILNLGQDELRVNIREPRARIYVSVVQGKIEVQRFTGTGTVLQSFPVNVPNTSQVDQFFVNIYINGEKWKKYDSLWDIPYEANGFMVRTGISGGIDVIFGNGTNGKIPPQGASILVEYLITAGEEGNITNFRGATFQFHESAVDISGQDVDLNSTFLTRIDSPITFGSNPEPLYLTRLLSPKTSRSFVLANPENYVHFFEKFQQFSRINAWTMYDETDPYVDNIIYLMLVPDVKKRMRTGDNYFTTPIESFIMTDLEKARVIQLIEESGQKIVTAIVKMVDPQFKKYSINMDLAIWDGYNRETIYDKIISKVSDYLLNFKRSDFLPKSDIITIIEGIDGVDSVKNVVFVSEDIETFIEDIALNGTASELGTYFGVTAEMQTMMLTEDTKFIDVFNDASYNERIDMLLELPTVAAYFAKHIDDFGDVVITDSQIPIFRGDWNDRYGTYINDGTNKNKVSTVNINFVKVRTKTSSEKQNKETVDVIRQA